jgi:hypothetical protein
MVSSEGSEFYECAYVIVDMGCTVNHSVKPLNGNRVCLIHAPDDISPPWPLKRWTASTSSNALSEHNNRQRTWSFINLSTLRIVSYVYMPISDKDVIILYISIIHSHCPCLHSYQVLTRFLQHHNSVKRFLCYTASRCLPSESPLYKSSDEYLHDSYDN